MRVLVIGEKTSQVKRFTQTLCKNVTVTKHMKYIFDYKGKWINSKNISYDFIFFPLSGHITTIEPAKGYGWGQCPPIKIVHDEKALEIVPIKKYVTLLRKVVVGVDEVWIATDPDNEGQNIGFEALNILDSYIRKNKVKIRRIWNSSLTDADILRSFENPIQWDDSLALGIQGRRFTDAWLGFAATRELTRAARNITRVKVLSVGRVQLPTLTIIVKRDMEHELFQSVDRWLLEAILSQPLFDTKFSATHLNGYFMDKSKVDALLSKLKSSQKKTDAIVKNISTDRKDTQPPKPLNTTAAISLLTKIMRISAKKALDLMVELYNKGYLSYPRTENRRFKDQFPHKEILSKLLKHPQFIPLISNIVTNNQVRVNGKQMGEEDHDPIHPTGIIKGVTQLPKNTFQVWDILCKYYISLFMPDYSVDTTRVIIDINDELFQSEGKVVVNRGWKDAHDWEKQKISALPSLTIGEKLYIHQFKIKKQPTKPPPRYTDSQIILTMERAKIGTKSSRPDILKKLVDRKYIVRKNRTLISTDWGRSIIASLYPVWPDVVSPKFTAHVEEMMYKVARKEQSYDEMIAKLRQEYISLHKILIGKIPEFKNLVKTLKLSPDKISDAQTTEKMLDILSNALSDFKDPSPVQETGQ